MRVVFGINMQNFCQISAKYNAYIPLILSFVKYAAMCVCVCGVCCGVIKDAFFIVTQEIDRKTWKIL